MKDREDKYTIEWNTVSPTLAGRMWYATLTITELWSIGHIIFTKPLKIDVFLGGNDGDAQEDNSALVEYDFGMEQVIPLEKSRNFIYNYAGENESLDPVKTVFSTIKFDLMHAFFHYNGDPNYSHLHWALYGNLKDRMEADDSFIIDDWEKENGIV